MKIIFFFLLLLSSTLTFSQIEKGSFKVMDSINTKYPYRTQEINNIVEIYSLSETSKEAVKQKVKNKVSKYQLKDLTKSYVDNVINYYQMNYIWLITDKIFSNFSKEEIIALKKLIKKKKNNILLDKFLNIEQDCIKNFNKMFE